MAALSHALRANPAQPLEQALCQLPAEEIGVFGSLVCGTKVV